jgi:hypothetical protein
MQSGHAWRLLAGAMMLGRTAAIGAGTCAGDCTVSAGHDAISHGIVVPPIPNSTVAACCAACKANPRCEAFVTGPCNAHDPVCKHWSDPTVVSCFLVAGYRGLKPAADRTTGCVRAANPTPAPSPVPPSVTAGWGAGWGFKKHGGLPPMPTRMQSKFFLNQSVVGYFVANNTGLANADELAAEARLGECMSRADAAPPSPTFHRGTTIHVAAA